MLLLTFGKIVASSAHSAAGLTRIYTPKRKQDEPEHCDVFFAKSVCPSSVGFENILCIM